jgi:GNAT superfamily N-acetyltransferase
VKIRKAAIGDLPTICKWREEAAAWLHEQGSDQWSDSGLTREVFIDRVTDSIRAGETWIAEDDDGISLGTIAVDLRSDPGLWSEEELENAFVVHRMITDRSAVGCGVGTQLLDHAERLAWRAGRKMLILDAWSSNRGLHAYYESQGFRYVRTVLGHYTPSATLFERLVTETDRERIYALDSRRFMEISQSSSSP